MPSSSFDIVWGKGKVIGGDGDSEEGKLGRRLCVMGMRGVLYAVSFPQPLRNGIGEEAWKRVTVSSSAAQHAPGRRDCLTVISRHDRNLQGFYDSYF
jgi:hypothetical protein